MAPVGVGAIARARAVALPGSGGLLGCCPVQCWDRGQYANWTSLSASLGPLWQLADSDGGGAIRRNESTNQHTQQIRQQDAVASAALPALSPLPPSLLPLPDACCLLHIVSHFHFHTDNVDCSKVCLSISKMVFVKWAHSPSLLPPSPFIPSSHNPPVSLLGFWICIAQQQQSQQQ